MAVRWYYVQGDARIGPVTQDEMTRLIGQGVVDAQTLVWRQGLQGWETAERHLSFPGPQPGPGQPPEVPGSQPPEPPGRPSDASGMSQRAERYLRDRPQQVPAAAVLHDIGPDGLYRGAPARGFGEAVSVCLRRYFTFSGRASRSEYWYFLLFTMLLGIVTGLLDAVYFSVPMSDDDLGPLNAITSLAVFIPMLSVTWRRLHDIGRSGWWVGGFILGMIAWTFLMMLFMGAAFLTTDPIGNALALMLLSGAAFLIYVIVMLAFMCTRGDPGPNRYG
ncbi:MAG: DUF805 domain-containing protein [Pararhodobacter sp.]